MNEPEKHIYKCVFPSYEAEKLVQGQMTMIMNGIIQEKHSKSEEIRQKGIKGSML